MDKAMKKKSNTLDKFFEALLQEDVIEAIFKSLTWFFAVAVLMRIIPIAICCEEYFFAFCSFFVLIGLVALICAYGVKKILVPIDIAIGADLTIIKELNELPGQTDGKRYRRVFRFLFGTTIGWIYFGAASLYVWFFFTAMGFISLPITPK